MSLSLLNFHSKVTGVPTPTRDHAILMAKFAKDCVDAIQQVLLELETALGPDTVSSKW